MILRKRLKILNFLAVALLCQLLVPSLVCGQTSGELVDILNAFNSAGTSGLDVAVAKVLHAWQLSRARRAFPLPTNICPVPSI